MKGGDAWCRCFVVILQALNGDRFCCCSFGCLDTLLPSTLPLHPHTRTPLQLGAGARDRARGGPSRETRRRQGEQL